MVAYEVYSFDDINGYEFIGMLPERRKNPERITEESVIKWARILLGDRAEAKNIFFKEVTIERSTGRLYWVHLK